MEAEVPGKVMMTADVQIWFADENALWDGATEGWKDRREGGLSGALGSCQQQKARGAPHRGCVG